MDTLINGGRPFTTCRANGLGLNRAELRRAVGGRVVRLFRGVYVDARVEDSRDLRISAVRLVLPREAVLCGDTAAWVLGIDTFPPAERFNVKPQCLVPHGTARSRSPYVSCREAHVAQTDILELGGVRITRPVRIASDALRNHRRPYALSAADTLVREAPIDIDELHSYVDALKGYPGIRQARQLAALLDARCESAGESWTRLRIIDAGFPSPVAQWVVRGLDGEFVARLDFAYPELRIAIEYDGRDYHSGARSSARDQARRDKLRALGWRIVVVTQDDILGRDPALELTLAGWLNIHPSLPRNW